MVIRKAMGVALSGDAGIAPALAALVVEASAAASAQMHCGVTAFGARPSHLWPDLPQRMEHDVDGQSPARAGRTVAAAGAVRASVKLTSSGSRCQVARKAASAGRRRVPLWVPFGLAKVRAGRAP